MQAAESVTLVVVVAPELLMDASVVEVDAVADLQIPRAHVEYAVSKPACKDRPVSFTPPALKTPADAVAAAFVAAVSRGILTPGEAAEIGRLVEGFVKATDAHDLAVRLEMLEQRVAK